MTHFNLSRSRFDLPLRFGVLSDLYLGRFKFLGHPSRTIRELPNEVKRQYRRTRFLKVFFEIPAFKMRVHLGRIIELDRSTRARNSRSLSKCHWVRRA